MLFYKTVEAKGESTDLSIIYVIQNPSGDISLSIDEESGVILNKDQIDELIDILRQAKKVI